MTSGSKSIRVLRRALLVLFVIQLLSVIQRLVFDFLGYMWLMIVVNFVEIAFIIFGIFGTHQYKYKYLLVYTFWTMLWLGFNILVILLYLNVGMISHTDDWLSIKQNHKSWFYKNGIRCRAKTNPLSTKESIENCFLKYEYVEVLQASVQISLAVITFGLSCSLVKKFRDEDEEIDFIGGFDPYSAYVSSNRSTQPVISPNSPYA